MTQPNLNILDNINKYVKDELAKDNLPTDAKYVIVGTVDNNGSKIMAAVNIKHTEKLTTQIAAIWEHDWDGNDTAGVKLIFVGK